MTIEVMKPTHVEVDAIRCELPVRYEEEDIPNDFPMRKGDMWTVTIDLATHAIRGWPKGRAERVDMKVCDEGRYFLLSGDNIVATRDRDYVPGCIPGRYGDYIEFEIDENGVLKNWDTGEFEIREGFFKDEE